MRTFITAITAAIILCSSATAYAASNMGGVFLSIEDGSSHACINTSNHLVSMTLVSAQLQRSQSFWQWLVRQKAGLGVKFDVMIQNQSGAAFNFPRAKQLAVSSTRADIGLLPMRFQIMAKYSLAGSNRDPYVNVGLDLYLFRLESQSVGFKDLMALINFSSTLPLPPNPYIIGVEYFGKFAQQIVDQSIQNGDEKLPVASFSFDLATDDDQAGAKCPPQALRDGVQAVLFDYEGKPDDGMIKADESAKYCYWFNPGSNRIVYSLRPVGGAACAGTAPNGANQLNNPLVAFLVSSWPAPGVPQPQKLGTVPRATPTTKTLMKPMINSYVEKTRERSVGMQDIESAKVQTLFNALTEKTNLEKKEYQDLISQAKAGDLAMALALKRCLIVGISPLHCE